MASSSYTSEVPIENQPVNFQKEISYMMHGFGDNPTPNPATVALMETIVLQQMRGIIHEALKMSENRQSEIICLEDVIFLMRHNKTKLHRLREYMSKVELVRQKSKLLNSDHVPSVLLEDDEGPGSKNKRAIDIIKSLDVTGEVENIEFDYEQYNRKLRAAHISETLSLEKYKAYHKARCASFRNNVISNRGSVKFKQWINQNDEVNIAVSTLDVLSYLAYETVAEIVDMVFLVRIDSKKRFHDPFSKLEGGNFCNPATLNNAMYIKTGQEGVSPITVGEVREVLRRFTTPRIGINGLFSRNIQIDLQPFFFAL